MTITLSKLLGLGSMQQMTGLSNELERCLGTVLDGIVNTSLAAQRDTFVLQSGVAAAGNAITNATAVTGDLVLVSTVAASTGVQLRAPTAVKPSQVVINRSDYTTLSVYPPSASSTIDNGNGGAAVSLSANAKAVFFGTGTTAPYHYTMIKSA